MIKNVDGVKITPKEKAKEIVRDVIESIESSDSFRQLTSQNTEKEKERIKDQMTKLKERIAKITKPVEVKK